jgi:hypothetical protein
MSFGYRIKLKLLSDKHITIQVLKFNKNFIEKKKTFPPPPQYTFFTFRVGPLENPNYK